VNECIESKLKAIPDMCFEDLYNLQADISVADGLDNESKDMLYDAIILRNSCIEARKNCIVERSELKEGEV
jgi:hypothetical protein